MAIQESEGQRRNLNQRIHKQCSKLIYGWCFIFIRESNEGKELGSDRVAKNIQFHWPFLKFGQAITCLS